MANRRRGEVEARIDGRPVVLCLTLGALCELEAAFAVDDLGALAARFAGGRLSARDLVRILKCGLAGGGATVDEAEVAALRFDGGLAAIATTVADLLAVTFGTAEGDGRVGRGGDFGPSAGPGGGGAFPWDEVMRLAFSVWGLAPAGLWAMTPRELAAALGAGGSPPLGRATLARLMTAFPDA